MGCADRAGGPAAACVAAQRAAGPGSDPNPNPIPNGAADGESVQGAGQPAADGESAQGADQAAADGESVQSPDQEEMTIGRLPRRPVCAPKVPFDLWRRAGLY